MHILIGFITAIAGLIWAFNSLQRSGFDLNSFNPFTWARRRKWEKLYGAKPMYNLKHPIEAATVIIIGALKEIGEITTDQKNHVLDILKVQLHLDESSAKEAFGSGIFMVKDELNSHQSIKNILTPTISSFSDKQSESLINIVKEVIELDGKPSETQTLILTAVETAFKNNKNSSSNW